jgi:hypothetical protein
MKYKRSTRQSTLQSTLQKSAKVLVDIHPKSVDDDDERDSCGDSEDSTPSWEKAMFQARPIASMLCQLVAMESILLGNYRTPGFWALRRSQSLNALLAKVV